MRCANPITITIKEPNNTGGLRRIQVPCGKCLACLKRYQNDWMLRISEEFRNHGYGIFFTLTYNSDSVPTVVDTDSGRVYLSVCKTHVQDWLKRIRTRYYRTYGKRAEISYFITSEYGPCTLRPHYHGVLFGLSEIDFVRFASVDWKDTYGYTTHKLIPYASSLGACRYVSKYCSKGFFKNPYEIEKIVSPTFHLVSKGFGLSYVDRMKSFHLGQDYPQNLKFRIMAPEICGDRQRVFQGQFGYSMPRYYKNKIYGEKSYLSHKVADYLHEKSMQLLDSELEQIQSLRRCSFGEATYIYNRQDDFKRLSENQDIRKTLGDFYDHSKL